MNLTDIIILSLVAVAFVAVIIRVLKKGSCGDCAQGGSCRSSKHKGGCPAMKGVDEIERELSKGVH
ncbi:hypothetical protein K6V98_02700 [Collinsella sp. AGMB00827]|uniref:FeoB-associated Cys-rich membrane protein n=1 Tax=Collinsella ureilytica TaxID=2869515 RepID=A0ABS7MJL1_9ACTN|nr:hypothetical protein [Collinsella urealyticum]MBY4797275.1 hypothetical protein [Collinsella urealyticum]